MQPEYLNRLGESVRNFVIEVERASGIDIQVIPTVRQNGDGSGQGSLEIEIEAHTIRLFIPTTGYFPDGAVRHELLHVHRFHVEGVPKLVIADHEDDFRTQDGWTRLDNEIEHISIVPVELQFHPDRRAHWEAIFHNLCSELHTAYPSEREMAVCLRWTFLHHVLPDSPSFEIIREFALQHGLLDMAESFADQFNAVMGSKEATLQLMANTFHEIPWASAAKEYINNETGVRRVPLL